MCTQNILIHVSNTETRQVAASTEQRCFTTSIMYRLN